MTLCRLLLCTGRQQDTPQALLIADVYLHQDPLSHWGYSLVLQPTGEGQVASMGTQRACKEHPWVFYMNVTILPNSPHSHHIMIDGPCKQSLLESSIAGSKLLQSSSI